MNDTELKDQLKQISDELKEIIIRSHSSLSNTYSNLQNDTNVRLAALSEDMKGIHRRQDIANGRTAHLENEVLKMKENEIRFTSTLQNHIEREEKLEDEQKDTKKWLFRSLGWWLFLLISGAFIWILLEVSKYRDLNAHIGKFITRYATSFVSYT